MQSIAGWDGAGKMFRSLMSNSKGALVTTTFSEDITRVLIDRSGVIATAGLVQELMPARPGRSYLLIQNLSDANIWINFGATNAVQGKPSVLLKPSGSTFIMEGSVVSTERISIICPTAGKEYTAKEMV